MGLDERWPEYCSLMGCTDPSLRPHHHHFGSVVDLEDINKISLMHCTCGNIDLPGTKPKEK